MSEHTPGPWELTKDGISIQAYPPPADVIRICLAPDYTFHGPDNPRWRANARLIAAAPDLLAACEAVEEWWLREGMNLFGGAPGCVFMVRSAIPKARGAIPAPASEPAPETTGPLGV